MAGFVTWRRAKLTEMSFLNAGLQRQIGQLDKENSLIQDKITTKASMQTTREMAASRLGMQKVTSEQIRYVSSVYFRAEIEIPDGGGYLAGQNLSEAEWLALSRPGSKNPLVEGLPLTLVCHESRPTSHLAKAADQAAGPGISY